MPEPEVHRYRRVLRDLPAPAPLPPGFAAAAFDPARHARAVHALLEEGYRQGGGTVAGFEAWRDALLADEEYDPDLVFLAEGPDGAPAAVALCWTSAFVKDLVVASAAQRRGLGRALLGRAFAAFRARGAEAVDLKVRAGNDAALRLYRSVGMMRVEGPPTAG